MHEGSRRREIVPVYWGYARRPFTVDTRIRALRIQAPPQLDAPAARCATPNDVARARQYIATTSFDEKTGLLGGLGSVFSIMNALSMGDNAEYRKDWKLAGSQQDPETLLLDETVIVVGSTITLSGMWSVERGAVVPAAGAHLVVTNGSRNFINAGKLPVGNRGVVIWFLATTAIGAIIVWMGTAGLAFFSAL